MDRISKQTRIAFREHLVGWTLGTITDLFDGADVPLGNLTEVFSGQRRTLVEEYYAGVDWTSARDTRRVLRAFEAVLLTLDADMVGPPSGPFHERSADTDRQLMKLRNLLKRDGFVFESGRLESASSIDLADLDSASDILERDTLREHLRRIEDGVDADPSQAVGSAKELVETVCKAVLELHKETAEAHDTLPKLAKAAFKCLDLTLDSIPEAAKGAAAMKLVMAGLSQIVGGTAEIRNLYGTGHGRTRRGGLEPRHARLVVGSAATLSRFLLDTVAARRQKQPVQPRNLQPDDEI
jgi:hypothetical protein